MRSHDRPSPRVRKCAGSAHIALAGAATLLLAAAQPACSIRPTISYIPPQAPPDQWRTHAEQTNYEETGRYDEAVAFCRRLAAASPYALYASFGRSGEGRELPLLIISRDHAFTPEAARRSGKPLVLIQNCIHSGECEGKDASLALARDILITGTQAALLDHANLLILPIFNADGHERRSPYGRANQNGPEEMGWRTNAVNLNLNRDYTKADAVEMQAWLRLWNAWQPDLLIDDHTTDGHDHQYDWFYAATMDQDVAEPVAAWVRDTLLPGVLPVLEQAGYASLPYSFPRDPKDPAKGIVAIEPMPPRFSTGYGAVCNRPSLLVETHALRPYGRRVRVTYDVLLNTLKTVNRSCDELRRAVRQADEECTRLCGGEVDGRVPLRFEHAGRERPFTYHAVEQKLHASEITGADVIEYTKTPKDIDTVIVEGSRVSLAIAPPAAYLIPPQWMDVIQRLELHGVRFFRLNRPQSLAIESYRFEDVTFADRPHEGRQMPRYKAVPVQQTRDFIPGTVVVPLNQPRAKLIVHLLEPEGPDSLAAWGFFNAIFEQKEYAEAYVMEPLARRMLAADPALRTQFEQKLAANPNFAASPGERLDFFYRRSPYWDAAKDVYPIARLMDETVLQQLVGP